MSVFVSAHTGGLYSRDTVLLFFFSSTKPHVYDVFTKQIYFRHRRAVLGCLVYHIPHASLLIFWGTIAIHTAPIVMPLEAMPKLRVLLFLFEVFFFYFLGDLRYF